MEVTVERDLIIAALIAFAIHGLLALTEAPFAYFPSQFRVGENKVIEISLVSAYRETEQSPPVKQKEKSVEKETGGERGKRAGKKKIMEEPVITRENVIEDHYRDIRNLREREKSSFSPSPEIKSKAIPEKGEIVSAFPRYRENPRPLYPPIARRRGYEGTTLLSLYVLEDGTVGEAVVKKTSGHSILDRAAVRAVKKWLFEPASRMGKAIPVWVDVPIRFVVKGKE
ncbi:MAG: energy transducer TonB [Thermodesulfobacteriota bacterium]|nr:energy transducer TonB [Thermodesulfobacteriota bacterium]